MEILILDEPMYAVGFWYTPEDESPRFLGEASGAEQVAEHIAISIQQGGWLVSSEANEAAALVAREMKARSGVANCGCVDPSLYEPLAQLFMEAYRVMEERQAEAA